MFCKRKAENTRYRKILWTLTTQKFLAYISSVEKFLGGYQCLKCSFTTSSAA